jgi:GMP synthase-like glutamine amidotransferase
MILVIYFDKFYTNLQKRLNENKINYKIMKYDDDLDTHLFNTTTVILTGSMKRILRENHFPLLEKLMKSNVKIIGICFGFQYLAYKSGGKVIEDTVFKGKRKSQFGEMMYFNHHDKVIKLPKQWKIIEKMDDFINIAATDKWIGFQFHPEYDVDQFARYVLPFLQM